MNYILRNLEWNNAAAYSVNSDIFNAVIPLQAPSKAYINHYFLITNFISSGPHRS